MEALKRRSWADSSDEYSDIEDLEEEDCDYSDEDPTFDPLELTRSHLSKLSLKKKSEPRILKEKGDTCVLDPIVLTEGHLPTISLKKKSKPRIAKGMGDESEEEGSDSVEFISPELNATDQKSFEAVKKMIHAGMIDKLKMDQCKVYLRKHGLRLTGIKEILLNRIKEHLEIINGGGERKYPITSFILNCKGDACTGDVVMFEQNVYEMYNIASRSATGPSCGKRTVAGRIVKESYGAEKQQHTFTIEVLWSKGEKPLPPLHPLLIKGRNLYRLRTLRQRWEDEGERQKMLADKHARGSLARSNRDVRLVDKEKRKTLRKSKTNNTQRTCKPTRNNGVGGITRNQNHHPLQKQFEQRYYTDWERENDQIHFRDLPPPFRGGGRDNEVNNLRSISSPHRGGGISRYHCEDNQGWEDPPHKYNSHFHDDNRRRKPCRFYGQGYCSFGERCKYLHQEVRR